MAETDMPDIPLAIDAGVLTGEMLYRKLGKTGEQVSAIGLGGYHVSNPSLTSQETIRIIRGAIDRGITFMDNSWDYNEGFGELRMGAALEDGYRQRVFLMTKIDGRTREEAAKQIEMSLERLRTDVIDLVQFHEVLRYEDADRIFADDGAVHAFLDAKQAGKLRHIGFTGHKHPQIHLHMLDVAAEHGFAFDTVQMPINVMDAHFRSFSRTVVPRLIREDIGVLAMKTLGGGVIQKSGVISAVECIQYALALPTSVAICGIDSLDVLDQAFEAVRTFKVLDRAGMDGLIGKTAQAAKGGKYEVFKTSAFFDQTAKNAPWLGGDSQTVKQLEPM